MMNETRSTESKTQGWKWATLGLIAVIVLCLVCVVSAFWGGIIGFAIGTRTTFHHEAPEFPPQYQEPPSMPQPQPPERPFPLETRPWLGVTFIMTEEGAEITSVVPESPAERAGLQAGDVITEVEGKPITPRHPLDEAILRYHPGDHVEITYERDGRSYTIEVRLGRWRPIEIPVPPMPPVRPQQPDWGG